MCFIIEARMFIFSAKLGAIRAQPGIGKRLVALLLRHRVALILSKQLVSGLEK